jgi:hypothetical protein
MTRRKHFLCLLVLPILCGCGGGDNLIASNNHATSTSRTFDTFEFTQTLPKTQYAIGEEISSTLRVRNIGLRDANLTFPSSIRGGYVVTQGTTEIASGSLGGGGSITTLLLKKGESFETPVRWVQANSQGSQVPVGQYTIRAWMTAIGIDGQQIPVSQAQTELSTAGLNITIN